MDEQSYLYFRKRPSGGKGKDGRGEYELVGSYQGIKATDLAGCHFSISLFGKVFPTTVFLSSQGRKPRLRLDNPNDRANATHMAGLLAAFLMLPSPCRSEHKASHALPVLQESAYLLDFSCKVLNISDGVVTIRPKVITARSGNLSDTRSQVMIHVDEREQMILDLRKNLQFGKIGSELELQVDRFYSALDCCNLISYGACRAALTGIRDALVSKDINYLPDCDPMPFLQSMLDLRELTTADVPSPELMRKATSSAPANAIVQRQRAERWYRHHEGRGTSGRRFSIMVRNAYHDRCAICGAELPNVGPGRSGIEAAHILPWAEFDLDIVPNGIALCRNHHWAFDSRVLRIDASPLSQETYYLSKGMYYDDYVDALSKTPGVFEADLSPTGTRRLERSLLPVNLEDMPSAEYLERFNALYGVE